MSFVSKFDADLPIGGQGSHPNAHAHVETVSANATHAPPDAIIVPDAQLLFNGDFKRSGVDLIVSKDDRELVLHDYFKGEKRAALSSPDGAHLTGDLISALTGHVQYAQADGSASVGKVIGHITKLAGTATAIRNGVSIILNSGDNVEKGDVVQSGSIRRSASPSSMAPCSASRRMREWCSTKWSTTQTGRTIHRCSAWWRGLSRLLRARPQNTAT